MNLVVRVCNVKMMRHNDDDEGEYNVDLPPSSSESDMNASCMASGATTRYFSSVKDVCIGASVVVTDFNESVTLM